MPQHHISLHTTADGSFTLYRDDLDEHYHSVKGALAESLHIYLHLGWQSFAETHRSVTVFEVGFGTGLNAALTARAAQDADIPTRYIAVELLPVAEDIIEKLTPLQSPGFRAEFVSVNAAPWDTPTPISPSFTLLKQNADILTTDIPAGIDVVYFDAFAPEKQPELWSDTLFTRIFNAMTPGGLLVTYCAKGEVRRRLQQIGFLVERLPGPPEGKREVLRATKS